jgi:predicted lipid-binding transport protein (Tim44 family)
VAAPDPVPAPPATVPARPAGRARTGPPPLGLALGVLIGTVIGAALLVRRGLGRTNVGLLDLLLVVGGAIVVVAVFLLRRRAAAARSAAARAAVDAARRPEVPVVRSAPPGPPADSCLERGLRDIRRTDRGFDPTRFTGYAAMVFRAAQTAWMTGDIESLRDRLTPEMHAELQAQCDRWQRARHANVVEQIEIHAEVTEAWQEDGRDYVTASIGGSMIDYTVDEASGGLVDGSRTLPRPVEEFWTFTRPAGLNFWMLSAIQTS